MRTVVVRLGTADPLPVPATFGPGEASKVVTEGGRLRLSLSTLPPSARAGIVLTRTAAR